MPKLKFDVKAARNFPHHYGQMLAMIEDGTREWRDELGKVSTDCVVWQPHPGGYSIGGVILHMAEVEIFWFEQVVLGKKMSAEDEKLFMSKEIRQYEGMWPSPRRRPISYYYQVLDDVRSRTKKALKKFPGPDTIRNLGEHQFTVGWIVSHVLQHESYHGGQLVMLKEIYEKQKAGAK